MTSPDVEPPITAPGVHDLSPYTELSAPKTQRQMRGIGTAMRYRFMADVLYAVSGVEIFGLNPFSFLSGWADDLAERANEAYLGALGAQESANFANAILGSTLSTNVDNGVEISESFNGPVAADFGSNWKLGSSGAGAGNYGPNGFGKAHWEKSGGGSRTHYYRHNTVTYGDYQVAQCLLSTRPQNQGTDQPPFNYLLCRVADFTAPTPPDTFVYARIGRTSLQVGCFVSGVEHVFSLQIGMDNKDGQVWRLQVGTDDGVTANPREIVVYRNAVEKWRGDDSGDSVYGASYRGVGLAAEARSRAFATDQSIPGDIDVFAAADLTAA